jgi:threonyl-tRNA synthetase
MSNVSLTFPDGSVRDYDAATTGAALAESISKSLAKKAVAYTLDGELRDLSDPLKTSGAIEIVTRSDPRALELIRHDTAHVLAEAVQELWPGTQVTIGPVIDNGFYYDFARNQPFTPDDFPSSKRRCARSSAATSRSPRKCGSRPGAKSVSRQGRDVQGRTRRRDSRGPGPQDLQSGRLVRPLPWAAHGLHRTDRQCVQADEGRRRILARQSEQPDADAHLRHGLGRAGRARRYLHMLEEAEKRDHRRLGREMDLFHFQEEGPGVVFWHAKGWKMFQNLVAYMRRRLGDDYQEVNAPQVLDKSLWETSGHWGWYQENMFAVKSAHAFTHPDDRKPISASSR